MMSRTKTVALFLTLVVTVALGSSTGFAQAPPAAPMKPASLGLAVYPGSGQDATQQGKDEGECYTWARQQTGIDPTVAATPAPVADAPKGGAVTRTLRISPGVREGMAEGRAWEALSAASHRAWVADEERNAPVGSRPTGAFFLSCGSLA
jgi:hypothetical protein